MFYITSHKRVDQGRHSPGKFTSGFVTQFISEALSYHLKRINRFHIKSCFIHKMKTENKQEEIKLNDKNEVSTCID